MIDVRVSQSITLLLRSSVFAEAVCCATDSGQTVAGIVVLPRGVVLHDERHEIHVASMKSRRRFLGN